MCRGDEGTGRCCESCRKRHRRRRDDRPPRRRLRSDGHEVRWEHRRDSSRQSNRDTTRFGGFEPGVSAWPGHQPPRASRTAQPKPALYLEGLVTGLPGLKRSSAAPRSRRRERYAGSIPAASTKSRFAGLSERRAGNDSFLALQEAPLHVRELVGIPVRVAIVGSPDRGVTQRFLLLSCFRSRPARCPPGVPSLVHPFVTRRSRLDNPALLEARRLRLRTCPHGALCDAPPGMRAVS